MPGISKMKNLIIVTGGAGFVGSNLIELLLKKTKYQIISLDNYSSGSKKNHIKNKRIKYLKGHTLEIQKILNKYKKNIKSIFHFGEFSRIYQSFNKFNECYQSNSIGSQAVFKFVFLMKYEIRFEPTNPAPPVTKMIFFMLEFSLAMSYSSMS